MNKLSDREIKYVSAYDKLEDVRRLITEYTNSLGIDLDFQNYDKETADLNGRYGPPNGRMYICYVNNLPAGIIGLTGFAPKIGEMKRLYVKPEFRGMGIAKKLCEIIISDAIKIGYEKILLDSLPDMYAAQHLYRLLGFEEIDAYYTNPVEGTIYMSKKLTI